MFLLFSDSPIVEKVIARFPAVNLDYVVVEVKDEIPYCLARTLDQTEAISDYRSRIMMNGFEPLIMLEKGKDAEKLLGTAARYRNSMVRYLELIKFDSNKEIKSGNLGPQEPIGNSNELHVGKAFAAIVTTAIFVFAILIYIFSGR